MHELPNTPVIGGRPPSSRTSHPPSLLGRVGRTLRRTGSAAADRSPPPIGMPHETKLTLHSTGAHHALLDWTARSLCSNAIWLSKQTDAGPRIQPVRARRSGQPQPIASRAGLVRGPIRETGSVSGKAPDLGPDVRRQRNFLGKRVAGPRANHTGDRPRFALRSLPAGRDAGGRDNGRRPAGESRRAV